MKIISVIRKSYKEQIRNFWILLLTITLVPLFVLVEYLIYEATKNKYELIILNQDKGIGINTDSTIFYGDILTNSFSETAVSDSAMAISVIKVKNREEGESKLKNKQGNLFMIIGEAFSSEMANLSKDTSKQVEIEFIGDLTDQKYIVSAVWVYGAFIKFMTSLTKVREPIKFTETSLGSSGQKLEFDLYVPGLMIFSIIMLMFSASIAIINEVEKQTMLRIKISKISPFAFLGISVVQVIVGLLSILLTLLTAVAVGFKVEGNFLLVLLVAVLTSISIIAFSLIVAAMTKSVNDILIIGNFPFFLFMFFSDAMFPLNLGKVATIGGYNLGINFILSPVHGVSALKKLLIMQMGFKDILPELISLCLLSLIYFVIGVWWFKRRHLKAE